jgi:hypothetical protein
MASMGFIDVYGIKATLPISIGGCNVVWFLEQEKKISRTTVYLNIFRERIVIVFPL